MVISLKLAEWPSADREWSWLREIAFDYDLEAYPKPRFDPIVTSERLVDVGWSDPLSSAEPRLARHPGRNGLMGTRHREPRTSNRSSLAAVTREPRFGLRRPTLTAFSRGNRHAATRRSPSGSAPRSCRPARPSSLLGLVPIPRPRPPGRWPRRSSISAMVMRAPGRRWVCRKMSRISQAVSLRRMGLGASGLLASPHREMMLDDVRRQRWDISAGPGSGEQANPAGRDRLRRHNTRPGARSTTPRIA
jgi:hypothetical protein